MTRHYDSALRRGALVNGLGLVGKILFPVLLVLLNRLFGPEVVGVYFLAIFISDMFVNAVSAGFVDAIIVYGSHHVDEADSADERKAALYRVLSTCFGIPLALSILIALLGVLGADAAVALVYPHQPQLGPALTWMGCALPLIAVSQASLAATKAKLYQGYSALFTGFVFPFLLLVFNVLAWKLHAGLLGMIQAYVFAYLVLAVLSFGVYLRHYELRPLLQAIRRVEIDRRALSFAIPQAINMTFNKYQSRLDVLTLGAVGRHDFELGLYSAAVLVTHNIREVKLVVSQALAPIAARFHQMQDAGQLEHAYGKATAWTTTFVVPVLVVFLVMRNDVLALVNPRYAAGDNSFMIVLLLAPFLSCAFGLAGNMIVFTGHTGYNLINSVTLSVLNTALSLWLIPRFGMTGAALASASGALVASALQMAELYYLERIALRMRYVVAPYVGLLVCGGVLWFVGDPARYSFAMRVVWSVTLPAVYGLTLLVLSRVVPVQMSKTPDSLVS
jgi:O-antigen/teichoic acid export membrane protein